MSSRREGSLPSPRTALVIVLLSMPALFTMGCGDTAAPLVPTTIQITGDGYTFSSLGETRSYQATVVDQKGGTLTGVSVSWSSTAPSVVEVTASGGQALARGNGSATLTASAGGVSGSKTVSVSQLPASLTKTAGDSQAGSAGAALAIPPKVTVADARGNAISGTSVLFQVTSGGGTATPGSQNTDGAGEASTIWTLGSTAGEAQALRATAGTLVADFSATADPGAAALVTAESGLDQTGTVLESLASPLVVEVTDAFGNLVSGVTVDWSTPDAGGSFTPSQSVTGSTGQTSSIWTLGGTAGPQTAVATVSGLDPASFSATALPPPVAQVDVTPAGPTIAVGGTVQLTAVARSAAGDVIPGTTFTWTSSSPAVATVDASGLVTGVAAGASTVSAEASRIVGASTVTVTGGGGGVVTIQTVTPNPIVEGATATITGIGFSAAPTSNTVTVGGLAAVVTSASTTQLQITVPFSDCLPPRQSALSVTVGGLAGVKTVTVTPASLHDLDVGDGVLYSNSGSCMNLAAGSAGEEYLIGVLSASESPSSLTSASLTSQAGIPVPVAPEGLSQEEGVSLLRVPLDRLDGRPTRTPTASATFGFPSRPFPERNWAAEAALRAQEREMMEAFGGLASVQEGIRALSVGAQAAPSQIPAVGDVLTLYHDAGCTTRTSVQASVSYVGQSGIFLEDIANPGPAFTVSELEGFDDVLTFQILSVLEANFGTFVDLDANARVLVLITQEVNKMDNVLGYVWSGDLFPVDYCARTNYAEMFYGLAADPGGTLGTAWTKEALLAQYPTLIAHELTHLIQNTQQIYRGAGFKDSWEMEGGATLAEKLVGHAVLGNSSRSNLGWSETESGEDWYMDWISDLALYFGWNPSGGRVSGAPEQCTWTGLPEDGNSGPCVYQSRAIYGVPAWLLQYVLDRFGESYPGGDAAAMQRMTQSTTTGFATLEDVADESIETILTLFGIALYADGRYWDAMESWDLNDIFQALVTSARLQPYTSSSTTPTLNLSVRGGSTGFLVWSPPTGYNPTSFRLRSLSGDALPDPMAYWIMRLR